MTRRTAIAVFAVLALLAVPVLAEDKKPMAAEFTAVFISMNAPGAMGSPVQIYIESWTTDDVASSLATTLQQKGQAGLVNALPNTRVGTIRIGTADGYPISVARQRTTAEGRVVLLASNRPFAGFGNTAASVDYPFGFIQLNLKADGTGEGTIIGAASISFDDKKNLTIGSYTVQPGRLSDVKERKPKK
jgi:methionyl-tRNA formyltransferase